MHGGENPLTMHCKLVTMASPERVRTSSTIFSNTFIGKRSRWSRYDYLKYACPFTYRESWVGVPSPLPGWMTGRMPYITTQVVLKIAPSILKAQLAFLSTTFDFEEYATKGCLIHCKDSHTELNIKGLSDVSPWNHGPKRAPTSIDGLNQQPPRDAWAMAQTPKSG